MLCVAASLLTATQERNFSLRVADSGEEIHQALGTADGR